ncbi:hypothetical protein AUW17_09085 [Tenacibaculum dicentrarchi]|nr:hypothetical protein AUW17_09085 [Tenacibaculum dicentrarchi]
MKAKTKIFSSISAIGRTPSEIITVLTDLSKNGFDVLIVCEQEQEQEQPVKNNYKGRKKGTKMLRADFLKANKAIVNAIIKEPKASLRKIAVKLSVSHTKVSKVKKILSKESHQVDLLASIKDCEP